MELQDHNAPFFHSFQSFFKVLMSGGRIGLSRSSFAVQPGLFQFTSFSAISRYSIEGSIFSTLSVQSFSHSSDVSKNGATHQQHSHESQATSRSNYGRQFHRGPNGLFVYQISLTFTPKKRNHNFLLSTTRKVLYAIDILFFGYCIEITARKISRS